MQIVRLILLSTAFMVALSGPAMAVTPEELAALARAGLGEEVLLALIESTGLDRVIDAERSLGLKRAGVSDRVIAAAVRASHRTPAVTVPIAEAAAQCLDCEANIAVIGDKPPVTIVQREIYYLPFMWGVRAGRPSGRPAAPYLAGDRGFGRFINDGYNDRTPRGR